MTDTAAPTPRRTPAEQARRAQIADGATYGLAGALPTDWIGHSGASVADALLAWERGDLADIPTGRAWDVVELPLRLGWDTVFAMRSLGIALGPVLSCHNHVDYFVEPGTVADWDLSDSQVIPAGAVVALPHPAFVAPRTNKGRCWISPPRGDGHLNNAEALRDAYRSALDASPARWGTSS